MNVLILTDLSEVAKNAGEFAVRFLSNVSVRFYLLNIGKFNEDLKENGAREREQLVLKRINKRINELKVISGNSRHSFSAVYSEDNLVNATRRFTEEKDIDLIIIGAANKGYSAETIVGNFTYEIIKKIKCNLLAIPENCRNYHMKKIVAPVDFSTGLNENSFNFLNSPGILDQAEVTLLSIMEDKPEANLVEKSNPSLQPGNRKVKHREIRPGEIANETFLSKVQKEFDLIVMLARNLRICDRFLNNRHGIYTSVSNCLPILVIH